MIRRSLTVLVLILAVAAAATAGTPAAQAKGVVNVNTATADQLQLLPRVGPALAKRIIDFRKANGPFKSADELVAVRGIGERSLTGLAPYIAVSGETTLTQKIRLPRRSASADSNH
ncbi:MAG: helix-hairpin-helix domain-containing protein [Acidobacteria bacterium]|jgi:competence protein ComEA|nr:helix-hairpin-helix domain-containing protein [Acidobacteriota bacterium]